MVQFESFKGSVVRVTAILSLAETWAIDGIDVVTLLGVGMPWSGLVRFRGSFPRTLNRTDGPVRGNLRTWTWTWENGSHGPVRGSPGWEPEPDRKTHYLQKWIGLGSQVHELDLKEVERSLRQMKRVVSLCTQYIQAEQYILIQVRLQKRSCRAICAGILTSEGTHNHLIIFLCLSWCTHMSITVRALQDLQGLECVWCQSVALLWVSERGIRERTFGRSCWALNW